jgi:hypothetical protein
MPLATAAWPNQLRDGEYPALVGGAVLSDGQGMGPFGGALDCTGTAIGILNIEISATGLCSDGTAWTPPSATLVAADNTVLDPLRSGERVDNEGPFDMEFTLSSRPGLPNWPQLPATPASGDLVDPLLTWVNEGLDFSNGDIHDTSGMEDDGVSRDVPGWPIDPTFLDPIFFASGNNLGDGTDITDSPTSAQFEETITTGIYSVWVFDRDELDNRTETDLTGDSGDPVALGSDQTDPYMEHTDGISNPDRDAFDLATVWAGAGGAGDDLTVSDYNYYVNWTDPITVGASGFTAFAGNPVWRQVHRVIPAGVTAVVGGVTGSTAVEPTWSGGGLANYGRTGASQQAVTAMLEDFGYYIYRSYVLDDAGNASTDDPAVDPTPVGTVTYLSDEVRRQAVVDPDPPTVFGITSPINMVGGTTITFTSNSSDNLDSGQSFLSLDYAPFADPILWAENSTATAPNTVGGYWNPVSPAPVIPPDQGTTGGVRHLGAESEHGIIFNDDEFERVASLVPTVTPLTRSVTRFIRSIEMVCGVGGPAFCPAAPADWVDISANLLGATPAGWFAAPSAGADLAYAAGRPISASFSQFDATRFDHVPAESGNINYNLEQIAPDDAGSPFPHRSVSVANIPAVSIPLFEVAGVETSVYHTEVNASTMTTLQNGWAISDADAAISGPAPEDRPVADGGAPGARTLTISVTARLISASGAVLTGGGATGLLPGPGNNLFPGPNGRVEFYVLEPATGTLRHLGSQNNPVVFENNPACVGGANQANYRCWDFSGTFTIENFVGLTLPVQVLAIGINAAGDALVTYPVDAS